jgi:putative exporter of polyketide antibiotics
MSPQDAIPTSAASAAEEIPFKPETYRTNSLATWSLVMSFIGLAMLLPVVGSILGLLGGKKALRQIEETGERGGGRAEAAIIFGWFGLVSASIGVIGIVVVIIAAANS